MLTQKNFFVMNIRIEKPSIYKLCITLCLAMMISLFLFACGSSKESSSGTETDSSSVIQDTSGAMRDTSTVNRDTAATMPADTTQH